MKYTCGLPDADGKVSKVSQITRQRELDALVEMFKCLQRMRALFLMTLKTDCPVAKFGTARAESLSNLG